MKRFLAGVVVLVTVASAGAGNVEILGDTGSYSQDFDSLPSGGTNLWVNDSTLAGWYAARTVAGTLNIIATNGALSTGSMYSFGSSAAADRALGSASSGTPGTISYGVQFSNTTANTYLSLTVDYTLEQWRDGGNVSLAVQTNTFWYMVSATPFTSIDADLTTGWTEVPLLAGISPTHFATSGTVLDGNVASNRVAMSQTFEVTIGTGESLMLRWRDINDTGNDHGMGIDDVQVSWSAVPEPATASLVLLAAVALVARRRRR